MSSGFYKMARGWMESPVFAGEPYSRAQAWCWLIERAAWKPVKIDVLGHTVRLLRGQSSQSTRYMASAWGWSEARVRRFLTRLKTDAMIDAVSDAGRTVITICNYDKYQTDMVATDAPSDAPSDAGATHERRIKEEVKERKKDSCAILPLPLEDTSGDSSTRAETKKRPAAEKASNGKTAEQWFDEFWREYPSRRSHSNPKKPARIKFEAAVKRGIDPAAIIEGARRYAEYIQSEGTDPRYVAQAVTWLNQERWAEQHEDAGQQENSWGRYT